MSEADRITRARAAPACEKHARIISGTATVRDLLRALIVDIHASTDARIASLETKIARLEKLALTERGSE